MQPSNPTTRVSLILRLNNSDDAEAWDEFVSIYQPLIWRIAKRMGMSDVDAADACQNTLLRLTQVVQQWSPNGKNATFRGWLYRVAKNCMLRQFEREKKLAETLGQDSRLFNARSVVVEDNSEQDYEQEFQRQVFLSSAQKVRETFKPMYWDAFWLTYVKNKEIKDVAELLDVSVGTIYVARSRVLKRIREEALLMTKSGFFQLDDSASSGTNDRDSVETNRSEEKLS